MLRYTQAIIHMSKLRSFFLSLLTISDDKSGFLFSLIIYLLAVVQCCRYLNGHMTAETAGVYTATSILIIVLLTAALPFVYRYYSKHPQKGLLLFLLTATLCAAAAAPFPVAIGGDICLSILYVAGVLALSYALLAGWSILLWFLWLLLPFTINLVSTQYQIKVDAHLVAEVLGASPQDAAEFTTWSNIALLAACILLLLGWAYAMARVLKRCERKHLFAVGAALLLIAYGVAEGTYAKLWVHDAYRTPECRLIELYKARSLAREMQSGLIVTTDKLPSCANPQPSIPDEARSEECICLLHVGESVRSDHLSLFGYGRKTTPYLDRSTRLIAYKDCISVAPSTIPATLAILTNGKTDIRQPGIDPSLNATCGGIMDIFHALDFSCYAFIMNENVSNTWGAHYELLLRKVFAATADATLPIPDRNDSHSQIPQIVKTLRAENNKRIFCFINNRGSHMPFRDYNHHNPPFRPASKQAYKEQPEKNPEAAAVACNTYDCTIHYWDNYIEKLLSALKGKPFVYLYIGDHGEYLGDRGIWMRNGDWDVFFGTPVCQVPFLIIASEEFEKQNPHFAQALARLREHRDMSIGQGHIFHTLLGLFGIQSPYYEEDLDLTSEKALPYTGPHPAREGKAIDGKKWY